MMDQFLTFSAEMTAFSVFHLRGTGLADDYFKTVTGVVGEPMLAELLAVYATIGTPSQPERDQKLRQRILGDDKLGPIARNIIKLWYIGIWEELPQAWTEAYGALENNVGFMVSAAAYTEGLLWPAIDANPPGAKAPGYASWVSPPQITVV
jgi:hypothetical protein